MSVEVPEDPELLFDNWRIRLGKKARGQIAPQHIVQSIENVLSMSFTEGQLQERKLFLECRESAQSRAMRHAFFAEREAARIPGLDESLELATIEKVAVIGAGTMGGGIAMCFASKGIAVKLLEINPDNLERGLEAIAANYQKTFVRGIISEAQKRVGWDAKPAQVFTTTNMAPNNLTLQRLKSSNSKH